MWTNDCKHIRVGSVRDVIEDINLMKQEISSLQQEISNLGQHSSNLEIRRLVANRIQELEIDIARLEGASVWEEVKIQARGQLEADYR